MPKDLWDHLKASMNNRSTGMENIGSGSSQFASMAPSPYGNKSVLSPVAPPFVPHAINPAGCREPLLGMEHMVSGSSNFASWIDGKGPFVPQPLPADAVPQVVVTSDACYGLTDEWQTCEVDHPSYRAYPSPVIIPVNYAAAPYNNFPIQCHRTSSFPIVKKGRYMDALGFQSFFINKSSTNGCNDSVEKGTCIWPNGTLSWSDKSCGIPWIAVHGMNSICVVTRNEDLEREVMERVRSIKKLTKEDLLHRFRQGIIYKVEDFADKMFKPRPDEDVKNLFGAGMSVRPSQMSDQSFKKPFGVVAVVIPGTHKGSGHEAPSSEYDEEKAIEFLQDEMKSNTAFTVNKTVQTAISALQHLFHKKFNANEIRVIVWKEAGDVVKELRSRDNRSIEEHIAVIRAR